MEIRDCKEVKKYLGTLVFFPCSSIQTKHKKEKELGSPSKPGLNSVVDLAFWGNAMIGSVLT